MTTKSKHPLITLNAKLGIDCYTGDFYQILAKVASLDSAGRFELIELCENAFAAVGPRKDEATRVAAAKVLVSLLPESLPTIKGWLLSRQPRAIYEVHFSLLCQLDEVLEFKSLEKSKAQILDIVTNYILKSNGDQAQACWMAADLLGDHWPLRESLPRLLTAVTNAKSPAARLDALSGLTKAIKRVSDKQGIEVRTALRSLVRRDPNAGVRLTANELLKTFEGQK